MFSFNKRNTQFIGLITLALGAIFAPDLDFQPDSSRSLAEVSEEQGHRALEGPTVPSGMGIKCGEGEEMYSLDWRDVENMDFSKDVNEVKFGNGIGVKITTSTTNGALLDQWSMWSSADGSIKVPVLGTKQTCDVIGTDADVDPKSYPDTYVTMEMEFDHDLKGLYISIGDVDSTKRNTDAVRIRMYENDGSPISMSFSATGTIKVVDDYAYEPTPNKGVSNPGYAASLYARAATGAVRTIKLDQSAFIYNDDQIGRLQRRGVFPAVDFRYCDVAKTEAPVTVPTEPPVRKTEAPVPVADTKAPVTPQPVTPAPVPAPPTDAPVDTELPPTEGGVNGDPLIIGLKGQLFKFEGRTGAWYSAISSPSFQWNMRISEYETCPKNSDTFVSGAGFTFFDKKRRESHKLEINVVNEYNVDIGCGREGFPCLGAGSLELILDGTKIVTGGNYKFSDGSGKILAFNTFYQCSRQWYDFDVAGPEKKGSGMLRDSRRLAADEDVFETLSGLKNTMIDQEVCENWVADRKTYGDLFEQSGHYSTIIVKTEGITFHVEYKQENERCNAHSLDVWMSSVSPSLLMEDWEGVIGETKELTSAKKDMYKRNDVLKFGDDADYEVNSPFATTCRGCYERK